MNYPSVVDQIKGQCIAHIDDIGEEGWLDIRKSGIGSSDAAAACGIDEYKCRYELYLEKTGIRGKEPDNEAMYWGKKHEKTIAEVFAERNTDKILYLVNPQSLYRHPEIPYMIATPDRLFMDIQGKSGILECKTGNEYTKEKWDDDKVPVTYIIQVQHQLHVLGLDYAYIAALIGGNKWRQVRIDRDEALISMIIEKQAEFWDMVVKKTPPPVDGTAGATELIKELYPEGNADISIDMPDMGTDAEEFLRWKAIESDAKKHKEFHANQIKLRMANAEKGFIGQYTAVFNTIHKGEYTVKATTYRTFDIKEPKIKKI